MTRHITAVTLLCLSLFASPAFADQRFLSPECSSVLAGEIEGIKRDVLTPQGWIITALGATSDRIFVRLVTPGGEPVDVVFSAPDDMAIQQGSHFSYNVIGVIAPSFAKSEVIKETARRVIDAFDFDPWIAPGQTEDDGPATYLVDTPSYPKSVAFALGIFNLALFFAGIGMAIYAGLYHRDT